MRARSCQVKHLGMALQLRQKDETKNDNELRSRIRLYINYLVGENCLFLQIGFL